MIIIIVSLYADDIILYLDHFDVSVSSIIKEFDNFSSLSGYKINWSKSALMSINNVMVNSSIPSFILLRNLSSVQGSRFLFIVTYTIIQGIISSEMEVRTGRSMDSAKRIKIKDDT